MFGGNKALLVLCSFLLIYGAYAFSVDDHDALMAMKASIHDDPLGILSDWEKGTDPCTWKGIGCDSSSRVISLTITSKILPESSHVLFAREEDVSHHISTNGGGMLVSNLSPYRRGSPGAKKTEFEASRRSPEASEAPKLTGTISPAIGNLSRLRILSLPSNSFFGEIPEEVASLMNLEWLDLAENELSGSIPRYLGNLPELKHLNLAYNSLQGQLASGMPCFRKLKLLNLARNKLSGEIPKFLGELPEIEVLDLSSNMFVGTIPAEITHGCLKLVHFHVDNNLLDGGIPAGFGRCSRLKTLRISSNLLSGSIPAEIGELSRLEILDVSLNSLNGSVPYALAKCSRLSVLILTNSADCHGTGVSMDVIGANHEVEGYPRRKEFNAFSTMPMALLNLPRLRVLWAPGATVSSSSNLPTVWGSCRSLQVLNLARSHLSGTISEGLAQCRRLIYLDLSGNKLDGYMALELAFNCMGTVNFSENSLKRPNLRKCPRDGRSSCPMLLSYGTGSGMRTKLRLYFSGVYDHGGGNVKTRFLFDLVHHGSSMVPKDSDRVHVQRVQLFEPSPGSALAPYENEPLALNASGKNKHSLNTIIIATVTSGCVIGAAFVFFLVLFAYLRGWIPIRRARMQPSERPQLVMFQNNFGFELTYDNVVAATGNFSVNNYIGSGGFGATYKAELSPGLYLAVKKIYLRKFESTQQFEAEVHSLGKLQHPNLVTLIGYYSSKNEMFLLYNYLPEGNLMSLIHDGVKGFVSWKIRCKIALDIAEALVYLHDERMLHRDIKPSNVLLDKNMNAFLSDFGLARLLNASETHVTTEVFGTLGYVAPEYVLHRRASSKSDVYSYGVLLLVLMSGKKAIDGSFSEHGPSVDIVAWASKLHEKGKTRKVFAPGLWEQGPQSELTNVLVLALDCTMDARSARPSMRQVVDRLMNI